MQVGFEVRVDPLVEDARSLAAEEHFVGEVEQSEPVFVLLRMLPGSPVQSAPVLELHPLVDLSAGADARLDGKCVVVLVLGRIRVQKRSRSNQRD